MTESQDFPEAIETARLAVENLPEHLQGPAFSIILERLLGHRGIPPASMPASTAALSGQSPTPPATTPLPALVKEAGSRRQQVAWALITLAGRSESATSDAVVRVIKDELGATPPTAGNASADLKGMTPRYATRTKVGRGYEYAPTASVAELLDGLNDE